MKNSLFCNYDRVFSSLLLLHFELEESQMHLNLPPRKKHQLSPAGLRQLFCFSSFRLCARRQLIRRTVVATLTLGGPARLRRRNTLHLDVDGADRKICLPLTSYTETHTRGIPWPLQGALDSGPEFIKTISSSFSSPHLSHRARGAGCWPRGNLAIHGALKIPPTEEAPWIYVLPHRVCFHLLFRCEIFLNILWRLDENFPSAAVRLATRSHAAQ